MAAEEVDDLPRRLAGVDPFELGDPPVGVGIAERSELPGVAGPVECRTGGSSPAGGTGCRCGRAGRCGRRPAPGSCRPAGRAGRAPPTCRGRRTSSRPPRPGRGGTCRRTPTSRRSSARSSSSSRSWLHATDASRVWWRGSDDRAPPVSSRNRSSRPRGDALRRPAARQRAAASSMASGMPSSRRQISPPPPRCTASSASSGRARRARSTNSAHRVVAVELRRRRSPVGGHGQRRDPPGRPRRPGPSGSRLVASTTSAGQARSSVVDQRGARHDEVLAVVEHDQRGIARSRSRATSSAGRVAILAGPHRRQQRRADRRRVAAGGPDRPTTPRRGSAR